MKENYRDERELSIRDLFVFLLRHWRSLLIVIVLGAALGGGLYMAKKASFEKSNAVSAVQENWVETYQVSPEIKQKMELAWENRQAYEKQRSYNENSLVMKMDAEHVYTGKLKYYIAAGSNTRLIAEKFNTLLSDGGLAEELKDAAGIQSEAQYIRELIGCDTNADNDAAVSIAPVEDGTAPSTKNVVVTYTVNYLDENGCRSMLKVLEDKADDLDEQLQTKYGGYTCEKLGSSVVLGVNSVYLSQQKTNLDYLQAFSSNCNSFESQLTGQDLEYYQITYLNKTAAQAAPAVFTGSKIKYLIAGIFLMVCLWGVVLVLRYVLDRHVKTEEDLAAYAPVPTLACLKLRAPKKGLDGAIEALSRVGCEEYDTAEYLIETIALRGIQRPMLCVSEMDAAAQTLCDKLRERWPEMPADRYPSRSAAALEKAVQSDGILLAVQPGITTYSEIERALELCRLQEIPIFGFLCVE